MKRRKALTAVGLVLILGAAAALWWTLTGVPAQRTVTWDAATAHVVVTDDASGHVIRTIALDEPPDTAAQLGLSPGNTTVAMAADERRGYAYVAQLTRGLILAVAATDGRIVWRASLLPQTLRPDGRTVMQAPVVDERAGCVISADLRNGRVIVLRASDGQRVASLPVPAGGLDVVVVRQAGRTLVFHGGQVDVVDDASWRRLRTVTIGRVYQYGPAVVEQRTARVFLASAVTGSVAVLDGATGRVIRVTRVGASPGLPIADEQAGIVRVPLWGAGGTASRRLGLPLPATEAVLDGRSGVLLRRTAPSAADYPSDTEIPADRWAWLPPSIRQHLPFIPPPPQVRSRPYELHFTLH